MASILKISDGTTTVDFLTDSAYRVINWNPAVATRRAGALAGRGPYEDVVEEMELFIGGATALAKLNDLQRLMDQAISWGMGEYPVPVLLHYKATASSSELKTTILGAPSPGATMIELPKNFPLSPAIQAIDPVILRFRRLGWWLGPEDSNTSIDILHPVPADISGFTAMDVKSPVKLTLNAISNTTAARPGFLLWASYTTSGSAEVVIGLIHAEDMATGSLTAVSDTTNKALGGEVLRYTATSTAGETGSHNTLSQTTPYKHWGVFVNYRNNSASTSFTLTAQIGNYNIGIYQATPGVIVPAGVSKPQWVYLGSAMLPGDGLGIQAALNVVPDAATSHTIDFDTMILLALDEGPSGKAVQLFETTSTGLSTTLVVDHRLLAAPQGEVYSGDNLRPRSYTGNVIFTLGRGHAVAKAAWLMCGGQSADYWRGTISDTVIESSFTAVQLPGYLIPE